MAQLSKPPIPYEMYRHFAVVTLMITAAIAMFAHGENEELEAARTPSEEVPQSKTGASQEESDTPKYGEAQLTRRDGATNLGSFGEEANFSDGYGQASAFNGRNDIVSVELPADNSENAGFTAAHLDKLSEEELQDLLRELEEGGIENARERQRVMAVLEAASRRRSGHREHAL
ncbi:hypothetical protein [Alteraurantiacibacter aquimixticola]|uniref:Transmembrane protein n=1 Tax=Alteraurantiacibacter aquimixticola TaxID=2489173 RepID=A0A4T3F1Q2_9SPHN|nr:hypothetical protein [Alteraurantiacibacter aquimixticola]TIX50205.1 hypothetical protein E5222_07895 [Alteraurantiacibacter aquimixticola]